MTDEQIVKALECCSRHGNCEGCPYADDECITAEGESILMKETVDLINRQKAGVEQWKEEANKYQTLWCDAVQDIQTAKSEAIKEFIKEHREIMMVFCDDDDQISLKVCEYDANTDNLVKEMVGEEE